MLIVVEGCDGVGKSTLVEWLVERIDGDLTVRHLGPPQRHPLEETVLSLNDYLPGTGAHVVCDRFHLGELIYGPIYRGESQLGPIDGPGHRWVDAWLRSVGGLLVLLDAELQTVLDRIDVRGDDFVKNEHLGEILKEYRRAFFASHCARNLTYMPGTFAETTLRDARASEVDAAASPLHKAGLKFVGAPHPKVVLVGDEPSPRHQRGERPTFRAPFVPYRDGCGWFLFGALTPRMIGKCAVINRVDIVAEHAEFLKTVDVVALGRDAAHALYAHDVPYAVVPHPQSVRRFNHARADEYGALIDRAAGTTDDLVKDFNAKENA